MFPAYENLSSQDKTTCGYKVTQSKVGKVTYLTIEIPSRTAKYCYAASLCVYDDRKELILKSNGGLQPTKDGGLVISAELEKAGAIELTIYSLRVPGVEAGQFDFGGFIFHVANES